MIDQCSTLKNTYQFNFERLIVMFSLRSLFGSNPQYDNIKKVDVATFKKGLKHKNSQLVDVRTPGEYQQGHIKKAILINIFSRDFKEKVQQLDPEKPVYLYCRSGGRSTRASKILAKMGFKDIYDLKGGYLAWRNHG